MEEDFINFLIMGLVIAFFILLWFFSSAQRTIRLFKSKSFQGIQQCKDNKVCKIKGKVRLISEEIYAPLSGRDCAVYRVIVEEYRHGGNSGSWHEIIDDERKTNFVVENDEQIAIVICSGAALLLNKDSNYESGAFNEATETLNKYLASFGKTSTSFYGLNKPLRYNEGILEEGEVVSIYGRGEWKSTEEFEELKKFNIPKVYVFKSTRQFPLNISDDIRVLEKRRPSRTRY